MRTLLLATCLLSATASATEVGIRELPCPFGEGNMRVYAKLSANRLGGWDSDLASYSVGGQWREYAISTCPSSLYSFPSEAGPSSRLQDPEYRLQLQSLLESARTEFGESPETWEKYEIAIRILFLDEPEPLKIARLYLQAAWTARDRAVDVYKGLEGPIQAWQLLESGAVELEKTTIDPGTRRILHYNLARIAHRGGFLALRNQHLADFHNNGPLQPEETLAAARFQSMVNQVEPIYLAKAALLLEAHIASTADSQSSCWAHYVRADIARRAGDLDKARVHYEAVLASAHADDRIQALTSWFMERL